MINMKKKWLLRAMFLIGFLLCAFPFISEIVVGYKQSKVVATYQEIAEANEDKCETILQFAQLYNDNLYYADVGLQYDPVILSHTNYLKQLDITGNGIMGSLDIPKIDVNLPIYHGTSEEVLANGIGHIEGTSLPVGNINSHVALSGHRGLPSSKLLVRLDEMEEGDYFYIRCGNMTMAYQVISIQVVDPEDTECIAIQEGKDLVSLVTCTPYGINTHRLVVTGEHVTYVPKIHDSIRQTSTLLQMLSRLLPIAYVIFVLYNYLKNKKKWRFDFLNDEFYEE